jgi:peptidoglycan/LPS O-acetylase OafA/YrhL
MLACVSALAALAMMAWSLFDPRPLQVIGAMSVGQAVGTLSFALYLYVVIADLRGRAPHDPSTRNDAGDERVE